MWKKQKLINKFKKKGHIYPKSQVGSDICLNCQFLSILQKLKYIMKPAGFLDLKLPQLLQLLLRSKVFLRLYCHHILHYKLIPDLSQKASFQHLVTLRIKLLWISIKGIFHRQGNLLETVINEWRMRGSSSNIQVNQYLVDYVKRGNLSSEKSDVGS